MEGNISVWVADDDTGQLYVVIAVNGEQLVFTPDKAREVALLIAKTAKEVDDIQKGGE